MAKKNPSMTKKAPSGVSPALASARAFGVWLGKVAAVLGTTPAELLAERADEPLDCYEAGDAPSAYAAFVVEERRYEAGEAW